MVNYQGKLTDNNYIPVPDGSYNLKLSIYDAVSGGSCLWTWKGACGAVTAVPVTVTNGLFSVMLGDTTYQTTNALNLDFNTAEYYLGVTVGGDAEMTDRRRIGAVGYAYNSDTTDGYHLDQVVTTAGTPSFTSAIAQGGWPSFDCGAVGSQCRFWGKNSSQIYLRRHFHFS
ncbi:MAG: hypothetical protein M1338_01155 [Patescibacteria group bacterium]|nr:hypothetical protein [Patescibacteria group bacterium]